MRGLLAVQSQDYAGAKWALAQRTGWSSDDTGPTDAELDRRYDAGEILRTHVLRPTWHFVAPEDARWLLALTAPRVHQASAYQYRLLGIDAAEARRAAEVFERVLAGGRALTRDELGVELRAAGIDATAGLRLGYLISHAELEGIVVSGPRKGRRHTYALLEERVPRAAARTREEALAELARRYVEGHGPAQAADLAWWSGLTLGDARRALQAASPPLVVETVGERTFWASPDEPAGPVGTAGPVPPAVHLLPNYDELLIAFRDRSDALDPALPAPARVAEAILAHVLVRGGLGVGGWRRVDAGAAGVRIELNPLVRLSPEERRGFRQAAAQLARFLGRRVVVTGLD